MNPRTKEKDMELEDVYNNLLRLKLDIKQYISKLTVIKDASRDNAFATSNMSKQINLYDTNTEFSTKTDQYTLGLIFDTMKPIFDKNTIVLESTSKQNEDYLFYMTHVYNDVVESIDSVERLKVYKIECLSQIKSIVR